MHAEARSTPPLRTRVPERNTQAIQQKQFNTITIDMCNIGMCWPANVCAIRLQTRKRQRVDCNSEAEENLQRNAAVKTSNFPNDKSFKALTGVNKHPGVNSSKVVSYEGLSCNLRALMKKSKNMLPILCDWKECQVSTTRFWTFTRELIGPRCKHSKITPFSPIRTRSSFSGEEEQSDQPPSSDVDVTLWG